MYNLCGAKTRQGACAPCRKKAMLNGRCALHGGKSTGARTEEGRYRQKMANWKHGLRSKETIADKCLFRNNIKEQKEFMKCIINGL